MNITRHMDERMVRLNMTTHIEPLQDGQSEEKWRQESKERILEELVGLLNETARVGNPNKLLIDFINRERKATTAIGNGVALPHIRSMQAKDFMLAVGRSPDGYDFGSLDGKPTHLFFVMAAPPYDDSLYLRVFKSLATMLQYESFRQQLMAADSPGEVIRAIRSME